ncbi:MAG: hypothetical protein ALECFALPRED_010286 [Alectoria fallacina]|uniref:Uncharacterized protein n=1 Tax=Alectoria fallacina TaxID=1903189 RepID=A0A8H3J927_9LECA|nr:MAG: hypothetical protein ALECFALPRED_010286 [Alectoria fallacina]
MSTDPAPKPIPIPATASTTINPFATSKKRTHDEISPKDEEMGVTLPPSRTPGVSPTSIHGEGIARIDPLTGTATTAESAGTWLEDQLEMMLHSDPSERAVQLTDSEGEFPKRKVQRRDNSSNADGTIAADPTELPTATTADPTIDQYTHLLGIGWTQVGKDSGSVAMARGFSRYIDNHYILTNSEVLLESKSLESYLVKTSQGYFLFPEDLKQARLVATTWEDTLANLQTLPVWFSGAQALYPVRTPDADRERDNDTGSSATAVGDGDIEMD